MAKKTPPPSDAPEPRGSVAAQPPQRLVFIVARNHRDLYESLRRTFADDDTVQVLLDRRQGERRQRPAEGRTERRRHNRRGRRDLQAQLESRGYALVSVMAVDRARALPPRFTYRGYVIEVHSRESPSSDWQPHAVVVYTDGEGTHRLPIHSRRGRRFRTAEEANRYAAGLAKAWVHRQG